MDHVIDGRADVRDCSAVRSAGCAEIRLNLQSAARFKGAAMDAEQNLGPAAHPFEVASDQNGAGEPGEGGRANAVAAIIATRRGSNLHRPGAGESVRGSHGMVVRALGSPASEAAFKAGINNEISACPEATADFYVVDEALAHPEKGNL